MDASREASFFMPTWREKVKRVKQDLIDMLRAIYGIGFRDSLVCDDELTSLLVDIANELGIDPDEYLTQEDTENSSWIPDEQLAGYIP